AQHALRQAKVLGDNVIAGMRGFPQKPYSHANKGAVAGLGLHKGVAMIVVGKMKIKLKGRLAWYMHRAYHGMAMPTFNRKIRVFADWTLGMFLKREVVSLGAIESPRAAFYEAAKPAPVAAAEPKKTAATASRPACPGRPPSRGTPGSRRSDPQRAARHPWCGRPLRHARDPAAAPPSPADAPGEGTGAPPGGVCPVETRAGGCQAAPRVFTW